MPRLLGRGPRVGLPKWGKCGVCAFGFLKPALPPVLSRPCGRLSLFLSCPFPFRPPAFLPLLFRGGGGRRGKGWGWGEKAEGRRRLGPDARAARSSLACRKPRRGLRGRGMRPMGLILLNIAGKIGGCLFFATLAGRPRPAATSDRVKVLGKGPLSLPRPGAPLGFGSESSAPQEKTARGKPAWRAALGRAKRGDAQRFRWGDSIFR